jgi:hypothetical protein
MDPISGAASGKPDSEEAGICKKRLCNSEFYLQQLTTNHRPNGCKMLKLYCYEGFSRIVLIS